MKFKKWILLGILVLANMVGIFWTKATHSLKKAEIWVGFSGTTSQEDDVIYLKKALKAQLIQGVVVFSGNVQNPNQLKKLIAFLKEGNPNIRIALDQEGGRVRRLKDGFASGEMLAVSDYQTIEQCVEIHEKAAVEMQDLGITDVFGPIVDVNVNLDCPAIGQLGRSFSRDPNIVGQYAKAVVDVYKKHGLRACLKHFPGHGSATTDSHVGVTDITHTWSEKELKPFVECVKAHPEVAVMVGHLMLRNKDGNYPASMSKKIIRWFERCLNQSGIKKVPFLIADGYEMKAVFEKYSHTEFLNQCSKAGINAVLFYCLRTEDYYPRGYSLQQLMEEKLGLFLPAGA
jgi:beta-N-acetylhexosaminidase